tara:strand:- start:568 stop:912 length:345 start_codon:yes stop_codon:yes gene_type:complete
MVRKLIINESQMRSLITYLNESDIYTETIKRIIDDLNLNYEPVIVRERRGGEYNELPSFRIKADDTLTNGKHLLYYLKRKYDGLGKKFLSQVIRDWLDGSIDNYRLSSNVGMSE